MCLGGRQAQLKAAIGENKSISLLCPKLRLFNAGVLLYDLTWSLEENLESRGLKKKRIQKLFTGITSRGWCSRGDAAFRSQNARIYVQPPLCPRLWGHHSTKRILAQLSIDSEAVNQRPGSPPCFRGQVFVNLSVCLLLMFIFSTVLSHEISISSGRTQTSVC